MVSEMHVHHKYVDEIQNLDYHSNLLNSNSILEHMPSTCLIPQMEGHNMFSIILSLLSNCK